MTIKELEIIIANDYLMDMLVYARCQLCDLGVSMHIPDLRYERSNLYNTLKDLKTEIENIAPSYKAICIYRRVDNMKL